MTAETLDSRAAPRADPAIALRFRAAWRLAGWASRLPFGLRWRLARRLVEKSMSGYSPALDLLMTNLRLCLPDWSETQRAEMLAQNATETMFAFMEQFRCWSLSERELRAQVTIENLPLLHALRGRGPTLFLCPHFLGAEFAGHRLGLEASGATIYTPLAQPVFEALRLRARERFANCQSIPFGTSMLPLVRTLRRGTPVLLMPDMDTGPRGSVFAPFFGLPAATTRTPAWCAARYGATIVPVSVKRVDGARYVTTLHPPVEGLGADIEAGTARINAAIEALVRANPSQYWWSQPRFATRPSGALAVYSDPVLAYCGRS
jgi:Kdo2-lipid IVA lauroyltransferase/acyltransferase